MAIDGAAQRENLAVEYTTHAQYASLHTADPAGTGANEVTGGTPPYVRRLITWSKVVDGKYSGTLAADFDVPANTTITHVGMWTALTGGTYLDAQPHSATFVSQGTMTITVEYEQF